MRLFVLLAFLGAGLLVPATLQAQGSINMPYSMYGIGDIRSNQYFHNLGMGGLSQAYSSNISVNDVNPASYSGIDSLSFVFEANVLTHFYEQETATVKQQSDHISLGNVSFAFPVTSWWSFGAGLKPYSQLGYSIRDVSTHPEAGSINYLYEGSGGINQLFLGSAFKPVGGLSVGVNVSYLFGDLSYEASVLSDSAGVFRTNVVNGNQVSGWIAGFGLQYRHNFTERRFVTVGATYGHQQQVAATSTETMRRYLPGQTRYDTIAHVTLDDGRISLPAYYGIGVYGRISRNWAAGVDYTWQNWESFEFLGERENFGNSTQLATGIQFSPTVETFSTIFHRMEYTAGFRYQQSYYRPGGDQLDEFGISFGTIIPIRGTLSGLHLNFEYSRRGSVDDHLMLENFYRVNVGINIYERWFMRRRFY